MLIARLGSLSNSNCLYDFFHFCVGHTWENWQGKDLFVSRFGVRAKSRLCAESLAVKRVQIDRSIVNVDTDLIGSELVEQFISLLAELWCDADYIQVERVLTRLASLKRLDPSNLLKRRIILFRDFVAAPRELRKSVKLA